MQTPCHRCTSPCHRDDIQAAQWCILGPPFGYALFYLKSVAPPGITMAQIYKSSLPFLFLQATGLALCIIFPDLVLWLPKQIYG